MGFCFRPRSRPGFGACSKDQPPKAFSLAGLERLSSPGKSKQRKLGSCPKRNGRLKRTSLMRRLASTSRRWGKYSLSATGFLPSGCAAYSSRLFSGWIRTPNFSYACRTEPFIACSFPSAHRGQSSESLRIRLLNPSIAACSIALDEAVSAHCRHECHHGPPLDISLSGTCESSTLGGCRKSPICWVRLHPSSFNVQEVRFIPRDFAYLASGTF
jgi:hypothetical protein